MKLLVIFRLEEHLYGLEGTHVDRFVPLVTLRPVPHTPEFVRGVFSLHGRIVPVIDLSSLLAGRPAKSLMSTRVVIVNFPCADGRTRALGLLTEKIIEMRAVDPGLIEAPPLKTEGALYLGPMLKDPAGLVQIIELANLLPEPLQQSLFADYRETG